MVLNTSSCSTYAPPQSPLCKPVDHRGKNREFLLTMLPYRIKFFTFWRNGGSGPTYQTVCVCDHRTNLFDIGL